MKEKKKINVQSSTIFMIMALTLVVIFSIAVCPVTMQNDTFYTVKVGEHIARNGVDMKEPFSWHEGLIYTYPHWLYDLISYLIYNSFGWQGIFVTTCLLSCVLGISIFLVTTKLSKNEVISFIITIGAMYVLKPYIAARAQLVTFILFIWTIFFIEKFLETKKWYYALGLIIIPIIIANVHAAVFPVYFVLFLPYIGEYIIANFAEIVIYKKIPMLILNARIKYLEICRKQGKKIDEEKLEKLQDQKMKKTEKISKIKIKRGKNLKNPYKIKLENNKNVKWLILIMLICLLTGLLTPIGDTPYTYLYKSVKGNTMQSINEHLPMTLAENKEALIMIVLLLAILTFTKTKIRLKDLFFIAGLGYLMLASKRQITLFTVIGTVILARLILQMLEEYKINYKKFLEYLVKPIPALFISVLVIYMGYNIIKPRFGGKYISKGSYPVKACDFILENIDIGKARFYNEYNYGSYMLYRGIPVFIDSRADVYDPQFNGLEDDIFSDFMDVSTIAKFYEEVFEKYDITHVITYRDSKMNMIIRESEDKRYVKMYEDDNFIIYGRTGEI